MSKKSTLQVIEAEIAEGKLGIARDRLHGLVLSYPDDLMLRSRLGDVYAKLGYPREAGRYWFLEETLTEVKREAVAAFVQECGADPAEILRRLRLRCAPEQISEITAKQKIEEMVEACRRKGLEPPEYRSSPVLNVRHANLISALLLLGCALFTLMALVGIGTVVSWLFS